MSFFIISHSMYPLEIFAVWHGGMSFHGGLIGASLMGDGGLPRTFWRISMCCSVLIGLGFGASEILLAAVSCWSSHKRSRR